MRVGLHGREYYARRFSVESGVDRVEAALRQAMQTGRRGNAAEGGERLPVDGDRDPRANGGSGVTAAPLDVLRLTDVPAAAALHVRAFDRFFLASLGEPFLRQFYSGFTRDPDAVTAVLRGDDGRLVGVVVGTLSPGSFFRRLLYRRGIQLAMASLPAVVRNPRAAVRLLHGMTYRGGVPVGAGGALLSSVYVDPGAQGSGNGRKLIETWWRRAQDRGATSAYLTTDANDNERTNDLYRRAGWSMLGSYGTPEGRRMNCYGISIGDANLAPLRSE
jgi:ribosomal protein S18 acetylase RimI-like enzyme